MKRVQGLRKLFLLPAGWEASQQQQRPQGPDGSPLPWFTYSAIEFITQTARPTDSVFEFGAGYSTLWWQKRVAEVHSVEHDANWCQELIPKLQQPKKLRHIGIDTKVNLANDDPLISNYFSLAPRTSWPYDAERIIRRGLNDERFVAYASDIASRGKKFDWIVIDGMARRLCSFLAHNYLAPGGVIVLDNSNRSDYELAFESLNKAGFRQIPFWGLVPGADFMTCTSLFIRDIERLPNGLYSPNSLGLPEY